MSYLSYGELFKYALPVRVVDEIAVEQSCGTFAHELTPVDMMSLLEGKILCMEVGYGEYQAVIRLRKEDMNKLRLVFLAALLTACTHTSNTPPQCSPAAYSALGELCTQAMAQALLDCSARTVETCPVAAQAAQACRVLMAAQDAECKGTAP